MTKNYSTLFLEPGNKVLIAHRRLFNGDKIRLFLGTVDAFSEGSGLLKITGYTFSQPLEAGHYKKKIKLCTKVISLTSGTFIVYVLPEKIDLSAAEIRIKDNAAVVLEDKSQIFLDLTD